MNAVFKSSFTSILDEFSGSGKRPVVFDILAPDWSTSLLSDDLKMVLHVNPSSMKIQYNRQVERIQTLGGWVEQHWGDAAQSLDFSMVSGGFMRLYSGLSNVTNPAYGGTRRDSIAYDKYLDLLALFKNNASVYDANGKIVFQGIIKCTFDGGVFLGWFNSFSVTEAAEKPYQFDLSAAFTVHEEVMVFKTTLRTPDSSSSQTTSESSQTPLVRDTNGRLLPLSLGETDV